MNRAWLTRRPRRAYHLSVGKRDGSVENGDRALPRQIVMFPVHVRDMTTSPAAAIRSVPENTFVRVADLPGSREAARQAASRAARAGHLVPVRKGLYYRGRSARSGMTKPRTEDVVREVLGNRRVGPAGYSAARVWKVTTQVPAVLEVSTLRSMDAISGVRQVLRRNIARVDLNAKEIALLELLRAPEVFVEAGWSSLVDRVRESEHVGEIREACLRAALPGERNAAVQANFARLAADLKKWAA